MRFMWFGVNGLVTAAPVAGSDPTGGGGVTTGTRLRVVQRPHQHHGHLNQESRESRRLVLYGVLDGNCIVGTGFSLG